MYKLRKSINTWINLHSQSLLKKRSQKHKMGLKCTAQDLPLESQLVRTKTCSTPSEISPGKHSDVAKEGKEPIKPLCGLWKRQEQLSFSCAESPVHSISELHRIPYVLSIDPHIDLTLLKTITVNF